MAVARVGAGIAYEVALMLMERQIAQTAIIEVGTVIFHLYSLWVRTWGINVVRPRINKSRYHLHHHIY